MAGRADLEFKPNDAWITNFRYEKFRNHTDYNAVKRRGDTVSTDPFVIEEDAISNFLAGLAIAPRWKAGSTLAKGLQLRADVNYQYGINEDLADGDRSATAHHRRGAAKRPPGLCPHDLQHPDPARPNLDLVSGDGPFQWVGGHVLS